MFRWVTTGLGLLVIMTGAAGSGLANELNTSLTTPQATIVSDSTHVLGAPYEDNHNAANDVDLEGTLEVHIEDRADGERYHHFLSTHDGRRWSLEGMPTDRDLLTGDRVRIRGSRSATTIRLRQSSSVQYGAMDAAQTAPSTAGLQVLALAPVSNTFGPQRLAVLLVNFSNDPSQPFTADTVRNNASAASGFFAENSYQQTSLAVDVFGWYTIPLANTTCDISQIKSLAQSAASARGVNLGSYTRQVYVFPKNYKCPWGGYGTVGGNPSSAWLNGDPSASMFAHELGHNYGLYHSNALQCTGAALGDSCLVMEYGDAFDTMGRGWGHFNAFQKERLGWLNYGVSPPLSIVESSGSYQLDAYETVGTGPKALRIARGTSGQSFYVELRRNIGQDARLFKTGVLIHWTTDANPNSSLLLDMVPETPSFGDDAFLEVGKTFADPDSGITITALTVSTTSATVLVDTGSSCTRTAPTVTASPGQSQLVPFGTAVTYNVSVTNTDATGCASSTYTLQATAPSGWQKSFALPSLTVSPGGTVSTTLQVTSLAVPPGSYNIVGTATNSEVSTLSGSAAMSYMVATSQGPGGAFVDNFDRADSAALGNGWVAVTGSLMIKSSESRNQANTVVNLSVQPGLVGAAQTVKASFASTNNNSAPRFGVVVRYQDPQNYYICYRQVGGSSVLRIAKVQNGVEKILKSAGVPNPAANAFSTLSCQASGSVLTLQLDGKTAASVSDGTFGTGSVGYLIKSTLAAAHRADNFGATLP